MFTSAFPTELYLIPENVYERLQIKKKKKGNELTTGCQVFYRQIYGFFYSISVENKMNVKVYLNCSPRHHVHLMKLEIL